MTPALQEIIELFEHLPEDERRENLISMAEAATSFARKPGQEFLFEDVRKDHECSDTVGLFLNIDDACRIYFAIELGPKVQTLTRAMAAILCRGLNGCSAMEILTMNTDFVTRIIGADLVRLRSQTVHYIFNRLKHAIEIAMSEVASNIDA